MNWIKEVIVDIAATLLILVAVIFTDTWMKWLIWAYSGILLFAKTIILFGDSFLQLINKTKTNAPEWFSHLLYATNTGLFLYARWWYLAGVWAAIWILSYLAERKLKKRAGASA